ncbi:hypothetical protein CUT02_02845 [Enterococcus faecium]|uniref:hypothetical protein n=1 Tax=Enterococcus faecium TaxID=1352 RepID=UPI000CF1D570|nr:hypothetical protein [Enterococcus faecium]PQF37898.1 hypothetical protein CUT02_02845 [Enterococcus faecium]PQF63678.1 hypothetical protein CUS78_08205 [Enterococcus faecium]
MQQNKDQMLSEDEVKKLEQNYIHSDPASFVSKIQDIYIKFTQDKYIEEIDLKTDFRELYSLAGEINPASLPYAQLTTLIFRDDNDNESTSVFITHLESFYISEFNSKKDNKSLKKFDQIAISVLAKTKEHLSLALNQKKSLYNEQKEKLRLLEKGLESEQTSLKNLKQTLETSTKTLNTKLNEAQNLADTNQKKYDKMTIDFLSMMGIFSTIIFAVFGGLSQIGAIGDNLAKTPISKILMYISLSAITLILIVFISFNAISKLTGLKLKSCSCKSEEECSCTIRQKHPTLSFSLFFFVDLFLFSLVLKAIRYSDWVNPFKDMFVLKADNIMKFLIFGIFIIFNFLVLLKLLRPKAKWLKWIKFI